MDLVTVAQAVHWFDLPRFYSLVKRVLRNPGGVIAVWGYNYRISSSEDTAKRSLIPRFLIGILELDTSSMATGTSPLRSRTCGRDAKGSHLFILDMVVQDVTLDRFSGLMRSWSAVAIAREQGVELLSDDERPALCVCAHRCRSETGEARDQRSYPTKSAALPVFPPAANEADEKEAKGGKDSVQIIPRKLPGNGVKKHWPPGCSMLSFFVALVHTELGKLQRSWAELCCFGCTCLQLWPKIVLRKWLNISSRESDFSADEGDTTESEFEYEEICGWERQLRDEEGRLGGFGAETNGTFHISPLILFRLGHHFRWSTIYVGTWNVAGRHPPDDLNIKDWLDIGEPADIYLRLELKKGRVFDGWSEGVINFPPTYKYELNSEKYVGDDPKGGRRTPAWCDRILSYGKGIRLLDYRRVELKFSDHRPVAAVFMVEVEVFSHRKLQRALTFTDAEVEDQLTACG
ncbi:hypothetical protein GW17_00021759 [Ensete ventricosum]|nr:hypothetical protein GW17_00021759 [Ensete ventricosum]